jgi:hypothetical protein
MARRRGMAKCVRPKSVLRFPDLEHCKIAVLNSLPAPSSQESYEQAIDEFIGFNRTVVLRYRFFLRPVNNTPPTAPTRSSIGKRPDHSTRATAGS